MTTTMTMIGPRWLRTGAEALSAMLEAIDQSLVSIRLETYIYTGSTVGTRFRDALVRAAERKVRVQVLVDALGSLTLPASFWEPLLKAGGEFKWFNPLSKGRWSYRNHRKLLVCDERIGFIGGFNISEEYEGDGVTHGWRDLGLQLQGDPARALAVTFDAYFQSAEFGRRARCQLRRGQWKLLSGERWKLLLSNSTPRRADLHRALIRDIAGATQLKIICAYFLPSMRLRKELLRVCRRGGTVQLILAGKSDVPLSQLASHRLYRALLRGGVEIYEYQPQILHAKLFIMDEIVYAGSANLDTRSLRINHELLVRLRNDGLATQARAMFAEDLRHSVRIQRDTWRKSRTFLGKLKEDWAYFVLARLDPYLARLQLK